MFIHTYIHYLIHGICTVCEQKHFLGVSICIELQQQNYLNCILFLYTTVVLNIDDKKAPKLREVSARITTTIVQSNFVYFKKM